MNEPERQLASDTLRRIFDLIESEDAQSAFGGYSRSINLKIFEEFWSLFNLVIGPRIDEEVGRVLIMHDNQVARLFAQVAEKNFGSELNELRQNIGLLRAIVGRAFLKSLENKGAPDQYPTTPSAELSRYEHQFRLDFEKFFSEIQTSLTADEVLLPVIAVVFDQLPMKTSDRPFIIEKISSDAETLIAGGAPNLFKRAKGKWRDAPREKSAKAEIVQYLEYLRGQELLRRARRKPEFRDDELIKLISDFSSLPLVEESWGDTSVSYEKFRDQIAEEVGVSGETIKSWRKTLLKEPKFAFYIEASWQAGFHSDDTEREFQESHWPYFLSDYELSDEDRHKYLFEGYPPRPDFASKPESERVDAYLEYSTTLETNDEFDPNQSRWNGETCDEVSLRLWAKYRTIKTQDLRASLNAARKSQGKN